MAESQNRNRKNPMQKFCLEYWKHHNCPRGANCTYTHKLGHEVEAICFVSNTDYFLGKLYTTVVQRPCHFFKLGKCLYPDNCRFLHDNDNSLRNNNQEDKLESDQSNCSTNAPSTSGQNQQANGEPETDELEGACASPSLVLINNRNWADAPEFVPKQQKSFAQAVGIPEPIPKQHEMMCPNISMDTTCDFPNCAWLHGDCCDMCERFVLHPYNEELRKKHQKECLKQHEKNMELSFAIQRSRNKTCGVCFEVIMEKAPGEQRFGILPNCSHCFCLTCIRKWRQARQFENKIIRACPECRVTSDFVCPSMYWFDTKEDKAKLIEDYKGALSKKDCKYFKKGQGKCPFGNKCFYLHATINGQLIDVGPPPRQRRRRNQDADMEVLQVMLWDFIDDRDYPWLSLADDLEDLVSFFTDSDESDWSDYEMFFD